MTWKAYEWKHFSHLLQHGYPLMECLSLLHKDSEEVELLLQQGMGAQEILLHGQTGQFYDHLAFFMKVTSLSNAVACALHMQEFGKQTKQRLLKECTYPVFIFVFSYVMMVFFLQAVIPQLLQSFSMPQQDMTHWMMIAMKLFCICIAVLVIVSMLVLLLYRSGKHIHCLDLRIQKSKWMKQYVSYQICGYLKELDAYGLSTKSIFDVLEQLKTSVYVHSCIKELKEDMLKGTPLLKAIASHPLLDELFCSCYQIGSNASMLQATMTDYLMMQEEEWIRKIKHISVMIQVVSYSFVAVLVLFVYQMMLMPLQMLEMM